MRLRRAMPMVVLASLAAGCGTLMNHTEPRGCLVTTAHPYQPYGGVALDTENATMLYGEVFRSLSRAPWDWTWQSGRDWLVAGGCTVDVPISVVADTLLLPYDVARAVRPSGQDE